MTRALDFQTIMFTLQRYWAEQGCLIWQPYYSQVGAGTMNPATFLRVLGPEPWHVAYVEPSVRPDDGRYGMNPNRLQQHYQFQVILKPDPGNPQELYLKSLEALGIDPRQHDIRFVEDNWESPALGAWGLGWEVWLDGQEITQFTYFQQGGGKPLDVVSVEITYGLERIAMALQKARNFKDIQWSPQRTYGDVNLAGEREHSTYYFEVADIANLRSMYDLFEREAQQALAEGLVLPAYDYLIKCSHTFNILDTRGAVGVTERQAFFGKMRDLSRKVADAYVQQRQELEFPWLQGQTSVKPVRSTTALEPKAEREDFLLEIGTEELPAGDLRSALDQLETLMQQSLANTRLEYQGFKVSGTPRRLVISVAGLQTKQADRVSEVKGPPAECAFDADGKPTKAAEGFARGKGISSDQLQVKEVDGGRYAVALITEKGRSSLEVLAEALPKLVAEIKFNKPMRWNDSGVAFSRPIRWLLALHGANIIPFEYANVTSDRNTQGLRIFEPTTKVLSDPRAYFSFLRSQGILLDVEARKVSIFTQVKALAASVHGQIMEDPALLEEVTQLVERPTAMLGHFDADYLASLPPDVLIAVMKKHQRYFPVLDAAGKLMPYFIIVRNGDAEFEDVVVDGNLQVILARFADAAFFIREDLGRKLTDFVPGLASLTFQKDLGSMLDKTQRIEALVPALGKLLGLDEPTLATTIRAASLCKADLASNMVVEMTSLQGIMGRYYALASDEPQAVADAIFEHYLPRSAEDRQPQTLPGLVVGMADRLDTLAGLFSVGLAPSGTRDPFAQRRAALGLVQNLMSWNLDFDLRCGLAEAGRRLPGEFAGEALTACLDFILGRLRGLLLEQGHRYDVVDAVLAAQGYNPAGAKRAIAALGKWVQRADWSEILPAYSRCVRITRDLKVTCEVNPDVFVEPEELTLYHVLLKAEAAVKDAQDVDVCLNAFFPMITSVNAFFDAVLVMSEYETERTNRLGLLQRVVGLLKPAVDLSYLEGF
jgi:glycyl-tRNA synthetase